MHKGNASDLLYGNSSSTATEKEKYIVPPTVLRVEGLIKIYGKRRVVDGVSFHVNKGEIVGLLGPNGAGKTTSFRMTCGLINTNGGIVYLGPHDVTNWPMYRRSREGGMGYLPQEKSVFQKLSVQNNLYGVMEMIGMKRSLRKRRCNELLEKFGLTHLRRNSAGGLSGGERRRLEIARALVSDPKIILLDEPFAAIDPVTVIGIQKIIRQLAEEGISILVTDHKEQATLEITQRSYIIQSGRVLCHGTPEEVLSNPEARKVYFGENVNLGQFSSSIVAPASVLDTSSSFASSDSISSFEDSSVVGAASSAVRKSSSRIIGQRRVPSDSSGRQSGEESIFHEKPASSQEGVDSIEHSVPMPPRSIRHTEAHETGPAKPLGRRLVPSAATASERPLVRSTTPSSSADDAKRDRPIVGQTTSPEPQEPAPGTSGVIRTLGAMIWGK